MKLERRVDIPDDHRPREGTIFIEEPAGTKTDGDGYQNDYTPEWFLSELLCRLVVKDLVRFKCVSKQWLSFISDPSFRSLFLSRRALDILCPFVFFPSDVDRLVDEEYPNSDLTQADTENLPQIRRLNSPSLREFRIRAADKGFLLLERETFCSVAHDYIIDFCIYNASTKQWFTLPKRPFSVGEDWIITVGLITQVQAGVLTSYRVVLVHCPSLFEETFNLQIFSSETGTWETLKARAERSFMSDRDSRPVTVNNTLYWKNWKRGISAYDLYACPDRIRYISSPIRDTDSNLSEELSSEFQEHQGRLKCIQKFKRFYFDSFNLRSTYPFDLKIWELQDTNEWQLQHTITLDDTSFPDSFPINSRSCLADYVFLSFHPSDVNVLLLFWGKRIRSLVSYNIQTRRMESLTDWPGKVKSSDGVMYWPRVMCEPCGDEEKYDYIPPEGFFQVLPVWPISITSSIMFGSSLTFER